MKTKITACLLPLVACLLFAGCGTPPSAIFDTQVVTNVSPAGVATVETNYAPRAEVTTGVRVAESFLPEPYGKAVGGFVTIALAIWAALAHRGKNKALKVAGVLTENIEHARDVIRAVPGGAELDKKYIDKIADLQSVQGVRADVHKLLNS